MIPGANASTMGFPDLGAERAISTAYGISTSFTFRAKRKWTEPRSQANL